jgi:hypothetical protein
MPVQKRFMRAKVTPIVLLPNWQIASFGLLGYLYFGGHDAELGEEGDVVGFEPVLDDAAPFEAVDHDKRELNMSAGGRNAVEVTGVATAEAGPQDYFVAGFDVVLNFDGVAGKAFFEELDGGKGTGFGAVGCEGGGGELAASDGVGVERIQKSPVLHVFSV